VSTAPAASSSPTGLTAPAPNSPAEQNGTATGAPAGIGDQVQDGAFAFTVTKVETGREALGDGFLRSEAQGSYVLVHVTVTNIGTESAMFTSANQKLLDAQGREFEADAGAAMMNVPGSESFLTDINPTRATTSTACSSSTCRRGSAPRPSSTTSRCSPREPWSPSRADRSH
jgi:hypothetical protein